VKFFQLCFLPVLLIALAAGCRKNIPEPQDWNLEKKLGQRNRLENRGKPADLPHEMPSVFFDPPVEPPVLQPADPDAQPVAQEEPFVTQEGIAQPAVPEEPVTLQPPVGRRMPRYNVPRSTRRLVVPVVEKEVEPEE